MFNYKAQGTIEYLVILSVVVVIALIIISLMTNLFSSPSEEITNSASTAGEAASSGISVVESAADSGGSALIRLSNNSSDAITLTKVSVRGTDNNYNEQLIGLDSKIFSLNGLADACSCEDNQKSIKCDFKIEYTTASGLLKSESKSVHVTCVNNITAVNPANVIEPIVSVIELGTIEYPWIVNDCNELQDINLHPDGNYALGADINCFSTRLWNSEAGFIPIGTSLSPFSGSLDGRNHNINTIYINRPSTSFIGLFGSLASTARIFNLGITDANITGNGLTGIISGDNSGLIANSFVTGSIIGRGNTGGIAGRALGTINASYSSATVISNGGGTVGGIVGNLSGTVSNCYSTGNVSQTQNDAYYVGGIAGWNTGSIRNTYSTGNIYNYSYGAGGITGYSTGTITNSFALGSITAPGGMPEGISVSTTQDKLSNVYWDTYLTGRTYCYYNGSTESTLGCTSTNNSPSSYYGSLGVSKLGNDSNWTAITGSYPKLIWEP